MAKWVGAAVFPDGERRFLVWNAVVDHAWPELFATEADAEAAMDAKEAGQYDPFAPWPAAAEDDEVVAIFVSLSYADAGAEPHFMSRAARSRRAITGPKTLEDAMVAAAAEEPKRPFWAKCRKCSHCWPAAYAPMGAQAFCRAVKRATCPMCGDTKPLIARQDNGRLLEDGAPAGPVTVTVAAVPR